MKKSLIVLALISAHTMAASLFRDDIAESKTPLSYIGKDTKAAGALLLTFQPDGGDTVARIAADSAVTVLLADDKGHFLVKNTLGITGWAQADTSSEPAEKLNDLKKDAINDDEFIVHYDPKNSTFLNKALPSTDEDEPQAYRVLRGKFAGTEEEYLMDCDEGMSGDPSCTIYPATAKTAPDPTEDNTLAGEQYYIPGNGYIYTDTDSNMFYETRSKFLLKGEKLKEIVQPYQYIGIDSTAENDFSLKGLDDKTYAVKKGEKVRVILDDPNAFPIDKDGYSTMNLLIQNARGETGWAAVKTFGVEEDDNKNPRIKDIIFHGD